MARILIVSGSYYPYATANAVCVKKFEDILHCKGHTVLYCNRKHDLYEPDHHTYEGTELYTVGKNSDLFFQTVERLQQMDMPNHMGACFRLANGANRMLMKLANIGKSHSSLRAEADRHYIDAYATTICNIVEKRGVDVILSVSMPFDSHRAVLAAMNRLKNHASARLPRWMIYCIDAYWSKAGVKPSDIPEMKAAELDVFKTCDSILFLDTVTRDYIGTEFDFCRDKMASLPLPLFDLNNVPHYADGIEMPPNVQNWLFAGTIYDDFSNADSIAEIIRLQKNRPIKVHLLGKIYPKSLALLQQVQKEMPEQVAFYGRQSYEFAKGSMSRADVLINLANDNINQIPSKIFEYMAYLKPVLNIYKVKEDVGTTYLRKYPLAFNLSVDNLEDQIDSLMEWSQSICKCTVTHEDLRQIYHDMLSETVTDSFYELIVPLFDRK